ncbi:MAG: Hsp33 family molecular chaperone HslO, partial [Pseudomonadota bacterium]|nr:Hsp33 family molecular chaperone HslO [Pseudomonadota bacterium]
MASRDQFQRFIFEHSQVRGAWVQLGESYQVIGSQAPYPDTVRTLLGEALVASILMSSTLKYQGTISIQAQGEGPLRTLMAECSHDRYIRGLARFDEHAVSEDSFTDLLGQGQMAITITPEQGHRYQGVVPRESDTLAGCLEDYFERSEQIATTLILFADDNGAAGLLLQRLPGATDDDEDLWERVNHLARTVEAAELLELDSETVLHRLFHE